jgi:hypothetical protein
MFDTMSGVLRGIAVRDAVPSVDLPTTRRADRCRVRSDVN